MNHESDVDKIFLHIKDPNEAKYQLLFNKRKSSGLIQKLLLNTQII